MISMRALEGLNPAQLRAATHLTGPALVVAGAGSGKTKTVVARIAYLISEQGVPADQILAVTFTNKAADELKGRVRAAVSNSQDLWVSTFHTAGVRILRRYGEAIGLKRDFVIYDDDDQLDVIKDVLGDLSGMADVNPRYLRAVFDRAKCLGQGPSQLLAQGEAWIVGQPKEKGAEVYRIYQQRLARAGALDFGDLLTETVRLLKEDPRVRELVCARTQFVHVDEYQDTHRVQYELIRLLAASGNLMVVGDPDQSIYRFRGADLRNILDFEADYPGAVTYRLEDNYRSSAQVLQLANRLIVHNQDRLEKSLRPVKPAGEPVQYYLARDHQEEAEFVLSQFTLCHALGFALSDMAVLYRTNAQSRVLEEAFLRGGMPARVVGGVGFYERREVKDLLAYARLAVNPDDDVAFRRIIGRPRRGIGDQATSRLAERAARERISLLAAARSAAGWLPRGAEKLSAFCELMDTFSEAASLYEPAGLLSLILDASGYRQMLLTEGQEGQDRLENLEELIRAAEEWSAAHEGGVFDFLDQTALLAQVDGGHRRDVPSEPAVTLMTLHNAKGLEFKVVAIVGLEEGLLPSRNSLMEPGGLEEERRLFYVGITRAMERLLLAGAESRMLYGHTQPSERSRFLDELGGDLIELRPYEKAGPAPAASAPRPQARAAEALSGGFHGGERVRHPRFGEGTVLAVKGLGDRQEVVVSFPEVGNKSLLARYANLVRLG